MGVDWTNRYVALERETSYGVENGIITSVALDGTGSGYNNSSAGTFTWRLGTKASPVCGGYGATGQITFNGSGTATAITLTNHGQGYTSEPNAAANHATGIEIVGAASGGSNLTFTIAGRFTSKGVTYGEVDDESMKQTFELLTRSDMSRQVASKAVTNTQYGEGSVNLAVQPDDFMGKIIHSFLPATETGTAFADHVKMTNRGGFYSAAGTFSVPLATNFGTENAEVVCKIELISTGLAPAAQVAADSSSAFDVGGGSSLTTTQQMTEVRTLTGQQKYHNYLSSDGSAAEAAVANRALLNDNDKLYFYHTDGTVKFAGDVNGNHSSATQLNLDGSNRNVIPANTTLYSYRVTEVHIVNPGKGYSGVPTASFAGAAGAAIGGLTSGGNAAGTVNMGASRTHVFNEPVLTTHAYPSYTMRVGRGDREHTFTGMVCSKLSFSANLNEYVMASVDFVGKNEEATSTLRTDVDFAGLAVDALHFADAEVYFEDHPDKTVKVQQISFEINVNRDLDSAYAVGNRSFTRAPPTQTREITGTMEFNEVLYSDTADYVNEPTYDDLTGSSVHKIQPGAGKPAIKLKFASESGADYIEFKLFNVRFEAPEASVSGRDPNRMSVGFQAYYDATTLGSGKAVECKLVGSGSHIQTTNYGA